MASDESSSSALPLPKYLLEYNLTQECKDLLPTLPCEKGWAVPRLHLYRGFWFPTSHLNGVLSSRNNFRARHDDVILASMPKSGTTWLKAILFTLSRHFGHSTGEDSSGNPSPMLTTNPHDLVPFLEADLYREDQSPDLSSFSPPRIFATHMPYSLLPESIGDSKCKIVYICRNVKDTFASTWHFTNKIKPKGSGENALDEVFDKFCKGVNAYGPYWDHLLGYWKASMDMPERVLFLKYEDVKERPVESTGRLAEFIGCPIEEDADEVISEITRMCSFESLSKLEVNMNGKLRSGMENQAFFRKGEVGDWMNLLSPQMAERLDCITKERLSGSGLML